jgi:hypothetical protein
LQLNQINARDPASPWPLTTTSTVNKGFLPAYQSPVSAVVHYRAAGDHIPTALLPFFGPGGAVCTDASAIADYGFRNLGTNPSTGCGSVH